MLDDLDKYISDSTLVLQEKLAGLEDLYSKLKSDKEEFEEITNNTKNYNIIIDNYTYALNKLDINIQTISNSISRLYNI